MGFNDDNFDIDKYNNRNTFNIIEEEHKFKDSLGNNTDYNKRDFYNTDIHEDQINSKKNYPGLGLGFLEKYMVIPNFGIIMSYGESDSMVPMGAYFAEGYCNANGEPFIAEPNSKKEIYIKFSEYELSANGELRKKKNGNEVYIPYDRALDLFSSISYGNYDKIEYDHTKNFRPELLSMLDEVVSEYMEQDKHLAEEGATGYKSMTLDSQDAIFVASDGTEMGENYSIFPFSSAKVLYRKRKKKKERKLYF